MARDYQVIDADGHVLEIQEGAVPWERLLPDKYKQRAPKFIPFNTNGGRFFIEGEIWGKVLSGAHDLRGKDIVDVHAMRTGMWEPKKRLEDMDLDTIDVSVLFGGAIQLGGLNTFKDAGFASAMAHAYNTWMHDFCAVSTRRLKAASAIAVQDMETALGELDHAVKDWGFVTVSLPTNVRGKNIDHPMFRPVLEHTIHLGVPFCVHAVAPIPGIDIAGFDDRFDNAYYMNAIVHPFEQMLAVAALVAGGVLDDLPKLRVGILEAFCGWVPFWFNRLDEYYESLAHMTKAKSKPSEYMSGGQMYFACEAGEVMLPRVIDLIGEDHILYASDYYHFDAKFPGSVKAIETRKDLTPVQKRKVLSENAARFFGLKVNSKGSGAKAKT